jgi:hypothetical protein
MVEDEVRFKKVHSLTKSCVASGFFESSVTTEAVALTSVVGEKGAQDYLKLVQAWYRTEGRLSKLIAGVRRAMWL